MTKSSKSSRGSKKPKPLDTTLYEKVKKEAKKKFDVWPSAYASAWLVREYKKRGGKYSGTRKDSSLQRWFEEEWVDVCHLPKKVTCGRPKSAKGYSRKYPYCRPLKRVSSKTPKTVGELDKKALQRRCARKRKNPNKKVS